MKDVNSLAQESIKSLGAGAYLVSVLPTVVLILTLYALVTSHLYPWSEPLSGPGGSVDPGFDSVVHSAKDLGVAGGVVFAIAILVGALLIRPFQMSAVQFLEGYWSEWGRRGLVEAFAVERHARRRRSAQVRGSLGSGEVDGTGFDRVVEYGRREYQRNRRLTRSDAVLSRYPPTTEMLMPTLLGNVLRRAETTSGERYGLSTVVVYPRLYPHLSRRLDTVVGNQLDLIDSASTFVIVLSVQTVASAPLLLRYDRWSLVPVGFVLLAFLSYRGATSAAGYYGQLLATAFDLHRFDMLAAMHRKLPDDAEEEYHENQKLSGFLAAGEPVAADQQRAWTYEHPPPLPGAIPVTQTAQVAGSRSPTSDRGSTSTRENDLAAGAKDVDDKGT